MIEKWKLAVKEFLKKYEDNDDVIGALLCGSYANNSYTDSSNINIYLVLNNNCNYHELGCTESNSYLIEYYMGPSYEIENKMKEEFNSGIYRTINMFSYGKVLYDLDNAVLNLQKMAIHYVDKPLNNITSNMLDINNYKIWKLLNELKKTLEDKRPDFNKNYFLLLDKIYDSYAEYLGVEKIPKTRIYKILSDYDYRKKYHVYKLPEDEFIKLYLNCYKDINYDNINKLVNYYYNKQGGFNIRQFKIRSDIS